jgi:hypothetical protein
MDSELPDFTFQAGVNQGQKTTMYTQQMESTTTPERSRCPQKMGRHHFCSIVELEGREMGTTSPEPTIRECGNPNMWGEILSHS